MFKYLKYNALSYNGKQQQGRVHFSNYCYICAAVFKHSFNKKFFNHLKTN